VLDPWLRFSEKNPNPYDFSVVEGSERQGCDEPIIEALGGALYECMGDPAFVQWLASTCGMDVARQFVAGHVVPTTVTTAVGDFGEVISGLILEEVEHLTVPIRKLRYRETAAGPMRLTDTFAVRLGDEDGEPSIEAVCFCSAKTATTPPPADIAVQGYRQLEQDNEKDRPEILSFVMMNLYRENNLPLAALMGDLLARRDRSTPRHYRLSLVMDSGVWREVFLEQLQDSDPSLPEFAVYMVAVDHLRQLIDRCYEAAKAAAA